MWEEVLLIDWNGIILIYIIIYNLFIEGDNGSEIVNFNKFYKEFMNFKEFVNYSIMVFLMNQIGDGLVSNFIFVIISEVSEYF